MAELRIAQPLDRSPKSPFRLRDRVFRLFSFHFPLGAPLQAASKWLLLEKKDDLECEQANHGQLLKDGIRFVE